MLNRSLVKTLYRKSSTIKAPHLKAQLLTTMTNEQQCIV